jgi:hypothetical protein
MEIDLPDVVAEVTAEFERYEKAVVDNDVATLDAMFHDDRRTLRYGVGENLYGFENIAAFRQARVPVGLARTLSRTVITTYGRDFAVASTMFHRPSSGGKIGRQQQTWARFSSGWRVVAAHVSLIDPPSPPAAMRETALELPAEVGRRVTEMVAAGDHQTSDDRMATVRDLIRELERSVVSQAAKFKDAKQRGSSMSSKSPIHPGPVDWTGENPGIYLKDEQDGPWTGLMCFFRIFYSAHGMGTGIVVLDKPGIEKGYPHAGNFCISDNEPLARYLIADFFSKFASFRVSPGIRAVTHLPMTEARREGSTLSNYSEIIRGADMEVVATWKNLSAPYAVDMPAENGPTKLHQMYSLFLDAKDASVTVNGRPLAGRVVQRDFAGTRKSTAFLAFSESWMRI